MQYSPAPFQKWHLTYNGSSFRDLLQKTHPTFKQRQRHLWLSLGKIKMEQKSESIKCNLSKNVELLFAFGKMVHRVDWFSITANIKDGNVFYADIYVIITEILTSHKKKLKKKKSFNKVNF